jgi:AcrR family transcriptional regulator
MAESVSSVKRPVSAGLTRRSRAKATHWRIVKAAYTLFCEQGYAGTTMAQIAEAASVAVQTVYFTFHTKSALLNRAYDFAVMGDEEPLSPDDQLWYRAMAAEPDVTQALRQLVGGVGEITRRVTPLYLAARAAADGDPDTAEVMAFHERWRADGYRGLVEVLRAKTELRPGLTLERATHLLLLFVGMDVYHVLVDAKGWSHEEWAEWVASTLADQLFDRHVS